MHHPLHMRLLTSTSRHAPCPLLLATQPRSSCQPECPDPRITRCMRFQHTRTPCSPISLFSHNKPCRAIHTRSPRLVHADAWAGEDTQQLQVGAIHSRKIPGHNLPVPGLIRGEPRSPPPPVPTCRQGVDETQQLGNKPTEGAQRRRLGVVASCCCTRLLHMHRRNITGMDMASRFGGNIKRVLHEKTAGGQATCGRGVACVLWVAASGCQGDSR